MTTTTQPAELTDEQRATFNQIGHAFAGSYNNAQIALLSAVEKSTGKTRGLIVIITEDVDSFDYIPVAVLLDGDEGVDLFETPEGAVVVDPTEV